MQIKLTQEELNQVTAIVLQTAVAQLASQAGGTHEAWYGYLIAKTMTMHSTASSEQIACITEQVRTMILNKAHIELVEDDRNASN